MSEQLFHVGIKAIAQNKRGEILLVGSRSQTEGTAHLDIPGGRMESNETLLQTLNRELREEIGLGYVGEPKQITATLSTIQIPDPQGARALLLVVYSVTLASDQIVHGDEEETYAWLSASDGAKALRFKYDAAFCELVESLGGAA